VCPTVLHLPQKLQLNAYYAKPWGQDDSRRKVLFPRREEIRLARHTHHTTLEVDIRIAPALLFLRTDAQYGDAD